jgi:hypothetical protein
MGRLSNGLLAGATGVSMLHIATYLDMAIRGRPPSTVPEQAVDKLAGQVGISLGEGQAADARRTALGALGGFATGISAGGVYGAVAPVLGWLPQLVRSVGLGLGVMAWTAAGNARLGVSDPRTWSATDWLEDLVPHVAYGVGTVAAFDAMS